MKRLEKRRSQLEKDLAKAKKKGLTEVEVKFTSYNDINFFLHEGYLVTPIIGKQSWYKVSTSSSKANETSKEDDLELSYNLVAATI